MVGLRILVLLMAALGLEKDRGEPYAYLDGHLFCVSVRWVAAKEKEKDRGEP